MASVWTDYRSGLLLRHLSYVCHPFYPVATIPRYKLFRSMPRDATRRRVKRPFAPRNRGFTGYAKLQLFRAASAKLQPFRAGFGDADELDKRKRVVP